MTMKCDKSIILKLKDVLFRYNEEENISDVLAVNNAILIAKLCIPKYYEKHFDLSLLFDT